MFTGNKMFKKLCMLSMILVIAASLSMTGCTKVKAFFGNNEALVQLTTEAATARVIHDHPQWKEPIANISAAAISAIDTGAITDLNSVSAFAISKIDMSKLTPEERVLVSMVISQITAIIIDDLKKNGSYDPASMLVEVRQVLGWVNTAAKI